MKITKSPSNHSHYELLLRAYEKAFSVYERSVTDEKTANHYLKISAKGTTKSELKILKLEYKRAKQRRKSRLSGLKIVKLRIKEWLKTNDLDGKVYELPEVQINDIQPIIEERKRQKRGPKPSKNETNEVVVVENTKTDSPVAATKTKATRTRKIKVAVEEANATEEAPTKATKKAARTKDAAELKPVKAAKVVAEKEVRLPKVEKVEKALGKNQDFTIVEGIGEKMMNALHEAGISTFSQLSSSTVVELKAVAYSIKNRFADPTTWPQQAQLVVENKHDELRKLQETLKGGKVRK